MARCKLGGGVGWGRGYSFIPGMGSFACPGIDTQVQGLLVLHLTQRTRQPKVN
jgi:hypothetical protein